MLSADDHPGLFYFMGGMIVLVMAAVGLSLVMDRKMKSSSGNSLIQREIASDAEEVQHLKAVYDEREQALTSKGSQLTGGSAMRAELRRKSESLGQRQTELEGTRDELLAAIPKLEAAFSAYRGEYRSRTWAGATGEKLGILTIRSGRSYQDAVITRVTDVGIEIRHRDGIARVQAPDLDQKWQDRFQWSDEERRARLKEELANHEKMTAPPEPAESVEVAEVESIPPHSPVKVSVGTEDQAKLDHLRAQVIAWKAKVARLRSEKSEAQSQASYGSQTSVGGSLETWKAKSARIGAELAKARAELAVAKSRLQLVSPNDILLRENPSETVEY